MLGIENSYEAYCVDEVTAAWGDYINGELDSIEGKNDKQVNNRRYQKLMQLLDAPKEKRFKSFRK